MATATIINFGGIIYEFGNSARYSHLLKFVVISLPLLY